MVMMLAMVMITTQSASYCLSIWFDKRILSTQPLVPLIMMLVMIIMNDNHEYYDHLYEYQAGTNMVMILRAGV